MTPPVLLMIALALPIVATLLVAALGKMPNAREAASLIVGVLLLAVNVKLAAHVFAGQDVSWVVTTWVSGFDFAFRIEPLGMTFALVASGLWIPTTLYGAGYMRGHHEQHQTRFFMCFAVAIFAALAAAYSANLLTLFVAYEVMTISTYPLVTHHGDKEARRGGRTYLGILISTSIAFFLLAVAWTAGVAGTTDFHVGGILAPALAAGNISNFQLSILFALFAFGVGKAALMPFHRWLPAAMVAPTPVSALLHAVAVVKVGVFTILKVCVYIFGIDLIRETKIGIPLAYLAGFTILTASIVAMRQDNLKRRLAYSTISQLAYITLGGFLATPDSIVGGAMHIVMHAMAKITLFFCAGAIFVAHHKKNISDMKGLGRKMPWTFFAFGVATVSIIGIPPGGGAWSKWFLAVGTVDAEQYILTAVLMISSLLNIAYLLPIPIRAFMSPDPNAVSPDRDAVAAGQPDAPEHSVLTDSDPVIEEAPLACVVPLCMTAAGSVALFFLVDPIYQSLRTLVAS
ncbi:MAG: proton-conducting transporter membrane subunit [Planctomycetota bacterium]